MPDLQTALSTALLNRGFEKNLAVTLKQWEDEDNKTLQSTQPQPQPQSKDTMQTTETITTKQSHRFQEKNGVTRATFEFVRDNPGMQAKDIVEALLKRGYKTNSTDSLIYQMVRVGMMTRDVHGGFHAVGSEYKTYSLAKKIKSAKAAKAGKKPTKKSAGIAALTVDTGANQEAQAPVSIVLTRNWTAEGVANTLTVVQARQLFDLLKEIFKG